MDNHQLLADNQIRDALKQLPDWELKDGELYGEFKFKDFKTAFAFMTGVAAAAEKINHHPNWENAYSRVVFRLSTHDSGGVTPHDIELAQEINQVAVKIQA